jgi:U3 small nucleolar RNA-associated protein 12
MVKSYLRYEPAAAFGVIVSREANIAYDSSGKHLLAPALEKVGVWHVRQGLCTKTLAPSPASPEASVPVTSIASSPSSSLVTAFFFFLGIGLVAEKLTLRKPKRRK